MKNTLKLSLILSVLLAASMSFGQTILTHTTLSGAVTASSSTTIPLTSATGVTAGSTVLFVADGSGEGMFVNSVNGTSIGVTRGYATLGKARAHLSGALVFVVPAAAIDEFNTIQPDGSCTRANIPYLPIISAGTSGTATIISDCVGGVWVNGFTMAQGNTPFRITQPETGAVITTGINTNGTTLAATTMYCTEMNLPFNKLLTGLGVLLGTTGGTDKHLVALYDSTGNLIANSAVAGATAGTASTYEEIAFSTSYYAVGPAQYFGCMQTNGTTATVRMLITNVQQQRLTKGITSQTFGTIPATITVPTTFTTAVGFYGEFY
jgi:hypothetical protein